VAALGARVYKPFDPRYADRLVAAARKAWTWAAANPNVTFENPSGVSTGGYGDGNCHDELLWAAAELGRTTGDAVYDKYFSEHYKEYLGAMRPPSWNSLSPMALWTYALGNGQNEAAVAEIRKQTLSVANEVAERTVHEGYRSSLMTTDYIWGSNSGVANYGLELLIANQFEPKQLFVEAAMDNLHYLLGRNTFSLSFLTQVGEHAVLHPHHRPSAADGVDLPWPGLLSGGPNRGRQDDAMKRLVPEGTPPARSFIDNQGAYSCNEVAINWNAPLVFLLAGLNGLE
jgi:endoglucanase